MTEAKRGKKRVNVEGNTKKVTKGKDIGPSRSLDIIIHAMGSHCIEQHSDMTFFNFE